MSSVPKMAADQLSLRHFHALTSADILLLGGGAFSELARAACAEGGWVEASRGPRQRRAAETRRTTPVHSPTPLAPRVSPFCTAQAASLHNDASALKLAPAGVWDELPVRAVPGAASVGYPSGELSVAAVNCVKALSRARRAFVAAAERGEHAFPKFRDEL